MATSHITRRSRSPSSAKTTNLEHGTIAARTHRGCVQPRHQRHRTGNRTNIGQNTKETFFGSMMPPSRRTQLNDPDFGGKGTQDRGEKRQEVPHSVAQIWRRRRKRVWPRYSYRVAQIVQADPTIAKNTTGITATRTRFFHHEVGPERLA